MECFSDEQYHYLVTAFRNFGDLQTYMHKSKCTYLTELELIVPAKRVVAALKAIHMAGYVHNNIQPKSLLLHRGKSQKVTLGGFSYCE